MCNQLLLSNSHLLKIHLQLRTHQHRNPLLMRRILQEMMKLKETSPKQLIQPSQLKMLRNQSSLLSQQKNLNNLMARRRVFLP
jgi:hypothetical protein